MPARRQACMPTESGSIRAPSSNVTLSGNLQQEIYHDYLQTTIIMLHTAAVAQWLADKSIQYQCQARGNG